MESLLGMLSKCLVISNFQSSLSRALSLATLIDDTGAECEQCTRGKAHSKNWNRAAMLFETADRQAQTEQRTDSLTFTCRNARHMKF